MHEEVTEYGAVYRDIISVDDMVEFLKDVNEMILEGWQPYGPPVARGHDLIQTMVQYRKTY